MRIPIYPSGRSPRTQLVMLLSAAVLACFAAGGAQAAAPQPTNRGWEPAPHVPITQTSPGWEPSVNAPGQAVEQTYAALPKAEQGGPGWHPITAAPASQGGPGRPAPDALVNYSTHVAAPAAAKGMAGNAMAPDEATLAANILFPPYSADLSGDATAALNSIAAGARNVHVNFDCLV